MAGTHTLRAQLSDHMRSCTDSFSHQASHASAHKIIHFHTSLHDSEAAGIGALLGSAASDSCREQKESVDPSRKI